MTPFGGYRIQYQSMVFVIASKCFAHAGSRKYESRRTYEQITSDRFHNLRSVLNHTPSMGHVSIQQAGRPACCPAISSFQNQRLSELCPPVDGQKIHLSCGEAERAASLDERLAIGAEHFGSKKQCLFLQM